MKQHSTLSQTAPVQHQAAAGWSSNLLEGSFWMRNPANLQLLSAAPSVPFTWRHKKLVGIFRPMMLGLLLDYVVLIPQIKRLSLLGAPITINMWPFTASVFLMLKFTEGWWSVFCCGVCYVIQPITALTVQNMASSLSPLKCLFLYFLTSFYHYSKKNVLFNLESDTDTIVIHEKCSCAISWIRLLFFFFKCMIFDKCVQTCAEIRSALFCSGCDAVQAILVPFIQTECSLNADLWKAFKPWAITDKMNVFAPW